MSLLKQFWIYAALLLTLVIGAIAFAFWDSADSASPAIPNTITDTQSTHTARQEPTTSLASEKPVPSDFPAPAKKLHQIINDSELSDTQSLEEKTQQLNQQLAEISKQLKVQGSDAPEQSPQTVALPSDTQERLSALKDHVNRKQSSSN